jgi:hypothetical protein
MGSPMCASHAVGRAESKAKIHMSDGIIEAVNLPRQLPFGTSRVVLSLSLSDCKVTTKTHLYPNSAIYICVL